MNKKAKLKNKQMRYIKRRNNTNLYKIKWINYQYYEITNIQINLVIIVNKKWE
jgi:hypothetical protein